MNLYEAKRDVVYIVKDINIEDVSAKIRIMELGILPNTQIKIFSKSLLKKTFLVIFNSSVFSIDSTVAKSIEVYNG